LIATSTLTLAFAGKYGTIGTFDLEMVIPYWADGKKRWECKAKIDFIFPLISILEGVRL